MKNISKQEYAEMTKQASPNSPVLKNCIFAFFVGGIICVIGQILVNLYQMTGLDLQNARTAVSITLIGIGAALTAIGIYDKIAKYAGAGSLVPITGFSNAVVSPAIEFKAEGFVVGVGAKIFTIAGPVLVYGISASILYGVIAFIFKLY